MRTARFYASLVGIAVIIIGVVFYIMAVALPVFQGPAETIIIVGTFVAPMLGYLLTVPELIVSSRDWRLMGLSGFVFAYYMVVLFSGA